MKKILIFIGPIALRQQITSAAHRIKKIDNWILTNPNNDFSPGLLQERAELKSLINQLENAPNEN